MTYLLLIIGLALLVIAGDLLVRGSVALASLFGIPAIIIGLTIVAFGTSAPELVVSLQAVLTGSPGIAIGNVVGSNIANILLVLGVPALITAAACNEPLAIRNSLYVLGVTLLFIAFCFSGTLVWWHGVIFILLLLAFLVKSGWSAYACKNDGDEDCVSESVPGLDEVDVESGPKSIPLIVLFILAGMVGLPIGAHLTVESGSEIALAWGVSKAAVGLSLIAIGTSLPELATSVVSIYRGQSGLALGNVLGSNLFNILAIMGITLLVAEVPVPDKFLQVDLWVMLAAFLVVLPFVFLGKAITRVPAAIFVLAYIFYIFTVVRPDGSV